MPTFNATCHHLPGCHSAVICLLDQDGNPVDESVVELHSRSFFGSEAKKLEKLGYIEATMSAISHGGTLANYQAC